MAAKQRLAEVVAQHAPVLYIHPLDHFMPCTVEWFMHHSELRLVEGIGLKKGTFHSIIPRGWVNARLLSEAAASHGGGGALQLDLDEHGRPGFPKDLIDDVPLYVNVKEVCRADGSVEALELNYMTFYAHNGSYWVAGMRLGAHDGDWEHLTVRVHPESGALQGVYFHAHRNHDGCWLAAPQVRQGRAWQVQREPESGRPVAYVALHGHGTYPVSGKVLRALFLVNDRCSSGGLLWRPRRCVLLPHLPHLTPAELRGGGVGRPLMRVWSKGCTIDGAESPPVTTDRSPSQPLGQPDFETSADGTAVYILDPQPSQQPSPSGLRSVEGAVTDEDAEKLRAQGVEAALKLLDSSHVEGGSRAQLPVSSSSITKAEPDNVTERLPPPGTGASRKLPGVLHGDNGERAGSLDPQLNPQLEQAGERFFSEEFAAKVQPEQPHSSEVGSASEAYSEALSDVMVGAAGPQAPRLDAAVAPVHEESLTSAAHEMIYSAAGTPDGAPVPAVEVVEDRAEWLAYAGQWGTTPSPATQRWFLNAEPAVSRTALQRVLHFPKEQLAPAGPRSAVIST